MLNVCAGCLNCEQHATNCRVAKGGFEICEIVDAGSGPLPRATRHHRGKKRLQLIEPQPLPFTARPSVAKSN